MKQSVQEVSQVAQTTNTNSERGWWSLSSTPSTELDTLFGSLFPIPLTFLLTFPARLLSSLSPNATTSEKRTCIGTLAALSHTNINSAMAPMTRNQKEQDEAALILLQMADPDWDSSGYGEEVVKDDETEQRSPDPVDQSMVDAESSDAGGQAAVVSSNSSSESLSAPSTPTSTSTFSVKGASMAEIDAHQRTVQQTRAALTVQQRNTLKLKPYSHYDVDGNEIGVLWQTRAEHRTYRQTQRRRGAKLVRAGTTTGMKLPRQR